MTDVTAKSPYQLKAEGRVHDSDIRHIFPTEFGALLTSSRDNSAQLISLPEKGDTIPIGFRFCGHTAFVNFSLFHPSLKAVDGHPCVITGSNDKHLGVWGIESKEIEAVLDGCAQGICCGCIIGGYNNSKTSTELDWRGDLVVGDWGGVATVFDHLTGRLKQMYAQHKFAVRGIGQIPGTDNVLSASSDKTIHQWNFITGEPVAVYQGHKDVVQCITVINQEYFATGSNDCELFLWKVGRTTPFRKLGGHDSLLYTVAWNAVTKELLTASEDNTVKVWGAPSSSSSDLNLDEFDVVQSISIPSVVWAVAPIPGTGEIATGGADGVLRIWTRDPTAVSAVKQKELEALVAAQTIDVKVAAQSSGTVGGMDISKMPSVNDLALHRGSKEGEKKFVRNEAGLVEVYVWSNGTWEKVGVVVAGPEDAVGDSGRPKKMCNGKPYDYVFDVDVEGKMLKLPYNVGDNVLETAKNFINENGHMGVTINSHDQIVNFILQNIAPEDAKQVPGLEKLAPGLAAGKAGDSSEPEPVVADPWTTSDVFVSFNAEGAQRKIREITNNNEEFAEVIQEVLNGDEAPLMCAQLLSLYDALPSGSRFPALDCIRYCIGCPSRSLPSRVELLHCFLSAFSETMRAHVPTSEAEQLVTARLIANCVATLREGSDTLTAATAPSPDEETFSTNTSLPEDSAAFLVWLITTGLGDSWGKNAKGNLLLALAAVGRNTALLLSTCPPTGGVLGLQTVRDLSAALTQHLTALLTVQPAASPAVPSLLRSLLTLLNNSNRNNTTSRKTALKVAKGPLHPILQKLESNVEVRELSLAVINLLE